MTAGLIAMVLVCLLAASTAAAQVVPPTITNERARAHFELAVGYFETAEYDEALREFDRAYELSRQPEILYNLHLVHERMGNLERAVQTLERYLAEAPNIEERPTLEARLRSLRERLTRSQSSTPARTDTPGGARSVQRPIAREPSGSAPASRASSGAPIGPIVSFAVAGAGAIAFGVFGTLALVEDGDVYDRCGDLGDCDEDDVSGIRTLSLAADIGLGVAVVGAALGVILLATTGDADDARSASDRSAIRVAPTFGAHGAGATVGARF